MKKVIRLTENELINLVRRIVKEEEDSLRDSIDSDETYTDTETDTEDFSNQMSYGDLKFAGNQGDNVRIYIKETPDSVIYVFIKKDGDEYYGKTGYEINFEGTNESYMVTDDYSGPEQTPNGWVKMKSFDDQDFYREFVERSLKLSDIRLQYLKLTF